MTLLSVKRDDSDIFFGILSSWQKQTWKFKIVSKFDFSLFLSLVTNSQEGLIGNLKPTAIHQNKSITILRMSVVDQLQIIQIPSSGNQQKVFNLIFSKYVKLVAAKCFSFWSYTSRCCISDFICSIIVAIRHTRPYL